MSPYGFRSVYQAYILCFCDCSWVFKWIVRVYCFLQVTQLLVKAGKGH